MNPYNQEKIIGEAWGNPGSFLFMAIEIPTADIETLTRLFQGTGFPEELYLVEFALIKKHLVLKLKQKQATGLAVFSTEAYAKKHMEGVDFPSGAGDPSYPKVKFDEAREIAKSKKGINSLIKADDPDNLEIHFIE